MGCGFVKNCKCCHAIQDWCRDMCSCCPCKCCKTAQVELKATKATIEKIEKKDIPFGYGSIHAGIKMPNNSYTTPVLELHTWREARMNVVVDQASVKQRVALGGIQTQRDNADRSIGPVYGEEHNTVETEETIHVIPIESIISIQSSMDVKKQETTIKSRVIKALPQDRLSQWDRCKLWCRSVCCCCCNRCRKPENKISHEPEEFETKVSNQQAERRILVTIEYIRYSNIHTPSHARVLSKDDQSGFYKDHFHIDVMKFYLVDNSEYEQSDFNFKRAQAAKLCCLVTQLKSMIGNYPDEKTIAQLESRQAAVNIGEPPREAIESRRRINHPYVPPPLTWEQ